MDLYLQQTKEIKCTFIKNSKEITTEKFNFLKYQYIKFDYPLWNKETILLLFFILRGAANLSLPCILRTK